MITNDQQLMALMMADLEKFMRKKSEEILQRWRDLIWENWYEAHAESENYTRTYEFFTSLVSSGLRKVKNGYDVVLYFDTSMMSIERNGNFIQHIQREILPNLIEEGYHVYNSGKSFEGAHAYEQLILELKSKNYFLDDLQREFGTKVTLKFN